MQNAYAKQKRLQKGSVISLLVPVHVIAFVRCMVIVAALATVTPAAITGKVSITYLLVAAAAAAALVTLVDFAIVIHTC